MNEDAVVEDGPPSAGAEPLMHPAGYIVSAIALFFIGFFGFFFNLLVIILMFREKQLWTPLNVILFNLVCSDFAASILGNPITLTAALAQHWIFGQTVCVIYGFLMSLLGITSITTLTVLSFERYVMICRPFKKYNLNRSGALILVCAIWLYALSLTVPPLIGWGAFVLESANISCSVNWESHTYNAMTYIMFLFTMGLVVPIGIILFSYLNIIRTMRQSTLEAGRVTKAETRVTLMIVVMILAFLVAWSPYAVLALVVAFGDSGIVSPGLAVVPAIIAKSSFCYNPLIYVGLNTQFQLAWKRLLGVHVTVDTSHGVDGEHTSGTNTESALEGTPSARFRGSKFLSFIFKVPDHDSIQSLSTCAATTVTIGTLHEVKECSGPALVENQEKGEASAMREGQEGPVAVEQREIRDDMQSNSFQESKVE